MKKIIFILLCAVPNLLSGAAAPENKIKGEKLTNFQKMIAQCPQFFVTQKEWDNHLESAQTIENILQKTHCGFSAGRLIELIIKKEKNIWNSSQNRSSSLLDPASSKKMSPQELFGPYTSLLEPMVNALTAPENSLFLYTVIEKKKDLCHAFVLEKKNNTWFIYQSFASQFSMAEWTGVCPWRPRPKTFLTEAHKKHYEIHTALHKEYGSCKPLTLENICNFLTIVPKLVSPDPKTVQCYIKMWDNEKIQQEEAAALIKKISNPRSFANISMALALLDQEKAGSNQDQKSDSTKIKSLTKK